MEQLIVRLGSGLQDPVHWLVWSDTEQDIIASGELAGSDELGSLKERAGQRAITALVPTSDVLLRWVDLPVKGGRKALAAVPFMLEDELTGDIAQHCFLHGPKISNRQAVAIVARDKMQQWLGALADAGLYCDKLIPDTLAVPHNPEGWSLLTLGEQVLLRQDEWLGLQGHQSWVLNALELYSKHQDEPVAVNNFSDMPVSGLANIHDHQQPLDVPMQVLAQGALKQSFNLLQGEFKPKRQASGRWVQWRLAASLAAIALLVTMLDKGIQLYQLNQQRDQLQAQIEAEFKRAFPDVTRIVNVRSQMRQRMATLEQGNNGVSLLLVMSQLKEAFANSQVKPQTLRFDSQRAELRIQAVASNFEALEQFKRIAEQKGFQVEQGAINNRDNQVISSLSIRS